MENQIFEAAFGLAAPWFVQDVNFDADRKLLGIQIDFVAGSRFVYPGGEGTHPVHDTQGKRYRHLNFFQHECYLEVRVPRLQLPDGRVVFLEPEWAGNLSGFTLLFGDLILMLARQMPFAAVARLVGESWQRVQAICAKYVHLAVDAADLSAVEAVAIDETSLQRGHAYLILVADAQQGKVLFVTKGRDATTLKAFAQHLPAHRGERTADHVGEPRYVAGLHQGRDERSAPSSHHLRPVSCHRSRLDCSGQDVSGQRETRSDVKVIALDLAQGSSPADDQAHCPDLVVPGTLAGDSGSQTDPCRVALLRQWSTQVMRSMVDPMKTVARMIRQDFDGIVVWVQPRQTNGLLEAVNGLFQAAKRKARGYTRLTTMRTVIFLIAGKLDFQKFNPYAT